VFWKKSGFPHLPKIIMDYGGHAILAKASAVVKQCDRAFSQHDATDLVSLLIDYSKFWKAMVVAAGLVETKVKNILCC
jgi:hypothetical protein